MYTMDNDAVHQLVSQQLKQLGLTVQEVRQMEVLAGETHQPRGQEVIPIFCTSIRNHTLEIM